MNRANQKLGLTLILVTVGTLFVSGCQPSFEVKSYSGKITSPSTDDDSGWFDDLDGADSDQTDVDWGKLSFAEKIELSDFTAEQSFTTDTLPSNDSDLISQYQAYKSDTGWKALAVSIEGDVFYSYNKLGSSSLTQNEASWRALEGCFVKSVAKKCNIFAEGNFIRFGPDEFLEKMMDSTLPKLNDPFKADAIPWVTDKSREVLASYRSFENKKALAINIYGKGCYRQGHTSDTEAARRAVQCCEWQSKGEACVAFAVGDKIVFDIKEHYYPKTLSFPLAPAVFDAAKVPFVSIATRNTLASSYTTAVKDSPNPIALAVNGNGDWAFRVGSNAADARAKAKAACESSGQGGTCLVYAIDNQVVLTKSDLENL